MNVWDVRLDAGGRIEVELPPDHNTGVVVFEGSASLNGSSDLGDAQMAWLDTEGELVDIEAKSDSMLLFLSGEPLGEPVVSHGPFVMNTGEEIYQAIKDFQNGKMGHLD